MGGLISRNKVVIALVAVLALCLLLRCLHLLNSDHYYMLSPDSHFFHWVSERYLLGETTDRLFAGHYLPTIWHTGLSYPLGWISIALASVFGLSRAEALTWACKFLPPLLGVLTALLIYWMGSRMYSRPVGIFAALSWAIFAPAIFMTAAGYIDRDALSLLLITAGVFVFYLSKDWQLRIGKLNLGWMPGALLVVGIEALLFVEWDWIGPVLLLALLIVYFAAVFLDRFYTHVTQSLAGARKLPGLVSSAKLVSTNIVTTLRETNWRPLAAIVCLNLLAILLAPDFAPTRLFDNIASLFSPSLGFLTTGEARTMLISDLFIYVFLTIPLLIGMYVTLRRRRPSDILWLTWFVLLFFFGLFSRRVFITYAAVAGGMLSGLGLGVIYSFRPSRPYQRLKKLAARLILLALLFLSVIVSLAQAYQLGSVERIAADNDWHDALVYLKENTPGEAVIMTWWDYGYWILDIAERTPVVDNGYRPEDRLRDIARAYCTNQDSEAVEVMQKYGASYLIFAKTDIAILPVISQFAQLDGDEEFILPDFEESLYARAPAEDFQSDGPLVIAYRNDGVVILVLQ